MAETGQQSIPDSKDGRGLEPEVIEFCHILARILARGTCRPLHNRDNCVSEPEDNPSRTTADQ
ncbi:hypothetical protein ACFLXE_07315 [Chloroflexota bacterium]